MGDKNKQNSESTPTPIADQSTKPASLANDFGDIGDITTSPEYKKSQEAYNPSRQGSFNPKEYEGYISNPNPETNPNLDLDRALNQSTGEQVGNAVVQTVAGLAGGLLMSAGTSLNMKEGLNVALGQEKEYKNAILDYGQDLMEKSQANFPIYTENKPTEDGKFNSNNLSDPGWWLQQGATSGMMAGVMGYSMVEAGILGSLTGGEGVLDEIPLAEKRANSLNKIFSVSSNSEKLKKNAMLYGIVNRHNEAVMEATQSFQDIYKEQKEKGVSEDQAKQAAAEGAAQEYRAIIPLAAIDMMTMSLMSYNPITKSGAGMMDKMLHGIKNPALASLAKLPIETAIQGTEGLYLEGVAQQEAQYKADRMSNLVSESNFSDRLAEDLGTSKDIETAISWGLGGALMGGGAEIKHHFFESSSSKSLKTQHADFIKNSMVNSISLANKINQAEDDNKPLLALQLRRIAGENQALTGLHLDNLLNKTSGYENYIGQLNNTLDIVNSGDEDKIKEAGIDPNSIDHIKNQFPLYIQDAQKIKELYDNNKETIEPSAVPQVTKLQFTLDMLTNQLSNVNNSITDLTDKIPDINNLSADGKYIFGAKLHIEQLNEEEKQLIDKLANSKDDAEKQGITKSLEELRKNRVIHSNLIDQISADPDRYTPQDRDIISSIPEQKQLQKQYALKTGLESNQANYRKQLEVWSDPKFQKANNEKKFEQIIDKTSTEEELNALKQRLFNEDENPNKPSKSNIKLNKLINDKLQVLQTNKRQQELNKVTDGNTKPQSLLEDISSQQSNELPNENPATPPPNNNDNDNAIREAITDLPFGKPVSVSNVSNADVQQTATATIVKDEESLFDAGKDDVEALYEPKVLTHLNEEGKANIKAKIAIVYDSMTKDNGQEPTFKELVEKVKSIANNQTIDEMFNVLKLGWELNNYAKTDFNNIYNQLISGTKNAIIDLINYAPTAWGVSNPYYQASNNLDNNNDTDSEGEDVTDAEENNGAIINPLGYKTSNPLLKLAYLHRPYEIIRTTNPDGSTTVEYQDVGTDLYVPQDVDSKFIMNPDSVKVGSKLTIKVAENAHTVPVSSWNKTSWERNKALHFGNWVTENNVVEGSNEYIGKIPLFVYVEGQAKPIAMIHDTEWYNPTNIGASTPEVQAQIIKESRQQLMALRRKILEQSKGQLEVTVIPHGNVTGQKWELSNDEKITVNEANPEAQIGYVTSAENIQTANGIIRANQLINIKQFRPGHNYDIRRWRTDDEGNPNYLALEVDRNKITTQAQSSIIRALQTYIMQSTKDNSTKSNNDTRRNDVEKHTSKTIKNPDNTSTRIPGIDLYTIQGLEEYLKQFIHIETKALNEGSSSATPKERTQNKIADIIAHLQSKPEMPNGTPVIFIDKGQIFIGKKGNKASTFQYSFKNGNENEQIRFLQTVAEKGFLSEFYQNVNGQALKDNRNMAFINHDEKGDFTNVIKGENYHDYLKNNMKTNVKSFNVGTKEKPVWATAYQPVINFTYEGQEQSQVQEGLNKSSSTTKVVKTDVKNPDIIKQATSLINNAKNLLSQGFSQDEVNKIISDIKNKFGLSDENVLHEPGYEKDTDGLVRNVSKKLISIAELNTTNKSQLVRYIARKIEAMIDVKYKSKVDMSSINDVVKDSFEHIFAPLEKSIVEQKEQLKDILSADSIAIFDKQLNNIDVVRKNYDALIQEAKVKEIYRYTGITEVKNKEIQDDKLPEEVQEEDREQQENNDENNIAEQGDTREANYTKTSLEENSKASVNNVFKRFVAQIPMHDSKGDIKRGFLGIEEYPGFDYYFNKLQTMLTTGGDPLPSFNLMIAKLETFRGKQPWVGEFIDRMKCSSNQMKNGFVSALCLHGTNTNFIMFGENKKTNNKHVKVYEANANEMIRTIKDNWYEQFKVSKLVNYGVDNTSINSIEANKLLDQFRTWKFDKKLDINTLPKLEEAKQWLSNFGIILSNQTIRELIESGYYIDEDGKPEKYAYNKMFQKSHNTHGIFGLLAYKLENLVNLEKEGKSTDFEDNEELHPLNDASGVLDKIANIQKTFDTSTSTTSHRDGQKSIFDLTPSKLIAQEVTKLINDELFRQQKLQITFDKQSYLLNLVNQFDSIRQRVRLSHGAINILKEQGKKNFTDTELNTLSDKDQEFVRTGMMMDTQQGKDQKVSFKIGDKTYELPMRIATMLFPVMSDKKINLNLRMPILSLNKTEFNIEKTIQRLANRKITKLDDFKTWDLGEFEGKKESDHEQEIDDYTINHPDEPIGKSGESFNQFKDRVLSKFQQLLKTAPDNAMIVTHSSVLKMFNIWNEAGRPSNFNIDPKKYISASTTTGSTEAFKSENGTLYVSRHGETEDNLHDNLRSSNTQLTDKGVNQAKEIGEKLKGVNIPIIYSSSLDRAVHTSNLLIDTIDGTDTTGTKEVETIKGLADYIQEFAYSQLIKPELDRIINHHKRAKDTNVSPDILNNQADYNKGAQMFHFIVEANNTMIRDSYGEVLLLKYIADHAQTLAPGSNGYNELTKMIKESMFNTLNHLINTLVDNKIESWKKNDFFELDKNGDIIKNKELNQKFIDGLDKANQPLAIQMAAYAYVVNNLITTANMHMIFDGDIANYSKDKAFKNKALFEDGCPFKPIIKDGTSKAYYQISEGINDVNLGKRLAMMIASGKYVGDAMNDKYVQLYLQDQVTHSSNISYLLDLFYGSKKTEDVKRYIDDLNSNESGKYEIAVKELSSRFPEIADYFAIESTDAQEYTTAKEALDLLFKQGRMDDEQYKILSDKIKAQKEAEKNNQPIPKEAFLTDKETKLVFTPMKPVVTDISPTLMEDNSRVTYIKSSSFPLLAQFTKGTELDKLRRKMEDIEANTNYNVRASYNTANKVGAVLPQNQLKIWNQDGTFNDSSINTQHISDTLNNGNNHASALILNRENFRIQQDVPFKAGKKKQDTISIGTQTMKELFSDGIANIAEKIFDYNGEKLNGKELLAKYNQHHIEWLANEKSSLYDDLGINEATGQPIDIVKTTEKLQQVLTDEVVKRGYPIQDLEAIGLKYINDDKGNKISSEFIIPIWLSPNSNRYEALLNAIVSNRLAKLKMPGNSFVVGSQEGFKFQTNLDGINQSKVVYSSKFDGELKATYTKDGQLQKAQVLVRSTFRNNKGELIDLSDPKYSTRTPDGKLMLKEDMIDADLLSLTSFRIPTTGHCSMSQIEIVGFLPIECADLMIVPKNFTKQKGLDFDVDKENTYQLWNNVDPNGKIRKLESFKPISETESRSLKTKLLQNEIVKIHAAILGNADNRIQRKINRVLSLDFARGQAELIESLSKKNDDYKTYTPLSDEYQKYKMGLGAAGKSGIGVYANYMVLHALSQQTNVPLSLMTRIYDAEEDKIVRVPLKIKIGEYESDGQFGKEKTLDGSRSIADVFSELANTATDNEKEQIMGRENINELTINVNSILAGQGHDKVKLDNGKEIDVRAFLLSQPIIKDYVTMMRNSRSLLADYNKNIKQDIISQLYKKYGGDIFGNETEGFTDIRGLDDEYIDKLRSRLSGQVLYNNLSSKVNNHVQQAILHLFSQIDEYSDSYATLQSKLNIQKSGLGKSAFDMISKYNSLAWFKYNDKIDNVDQLIGDYINNDEFKSTSRQDRQAKGYIDFDTYAVKPTTPIGAILANLTKSGFELWSGFFPHTNSVLNKEMEKITGLFGDEIKEQRKIELKQEIFSELKKFLFSSNKLGLFNGNPQNERNRLFFDRDGNESLASYLNRQVRSDEYGDILKANKLISLFSYSLNKNGQPSLIKYNNADSEDFNEEYKYQALIELMDMNTPLPSYNGVEHYTTRKLARDLINYTYLSGGVQKAIEFVKYVPVAYLQEIGFADTVQKWQQHANNPTSILWKTVLGSVDTDDKWSVSKFAMQYVQHNPEKIPSTIPDMMVKSTVEYQGDKKLQNIMSFEIRNEAHPTQFVRVYNKDIKQGNKNQLYIYDGKKYNRIPTLGTFGMSEYSNKDVSVQPLITQMINKKPLQLFGSPIKPEAAQLPISEGRETLFDINKNNLKETLNQIAKANISNISALTTLILPYVKNIPVNIESLEDGRAQYKYNTTGSKEEGSITFDKGYLNDKYTTDYMVARTVLHETIHSITARELSKYFNKDGTLKGKKEDLPAHVSKLLRVFNDVQDKMAKEVAELKDYYANKDKDSTGTLQKEDDRLAYGALNIFEFTAMIMSEPEFQAKMATFRYRQTDKNFLEQFIDAIKDILQRVGIDFRKDSLAAHGLDAAIRLIDASNEKEKESEEKFIKNDSNPFAKLGVSNKASDISNMTKIVEDDIFNEPNLDNWKDKENKSDCPF